MINPQINETGGIDPFVIDSPICASKILMEVCTFEEVETIKINVTQQQKLCYLDSATS